MWGEPEDFRLLSRLVFAELAIQRSIYAHHVNASGLARTRYDAACPLEQRAANIRRLEKLSALLPITIQSPDRPGWAPGE